VHDIQIFRVSPALLFLQFLHVYVSICYIDSIDEDFEVATVCYRPDSVDKLMELTKFTRTELKVLYRSFKSVRNFDLFHV